MIRNVVVADTGPLYALIHDRDQYHERARADLAAIQSERRLVVVVYPTVLESYSLILKRHSASTAIRWLNEMLRQSPPLEPLEEDYRLAIETVRRFTDQAMTLFDAVLARFAIRENLPVWTFDHHFDILKAHRWYPGV